MAAVREEAAIEFEDGECSDSGDDDVSINL